MKSIHQLRILLIALLLLGLAGAPPAMAALDVQCPEDVDGIDADGDGDPNNDIVCRHITGGDGYATMADGRRMYIFSFGNADDHQPLTPGGPALEEVMSNKFLKAELPAPLITVRQGQELYLTMTNVTMVLRPDLFDPHSVHWHGFPNAAPIFDGLPEPSPTANMGASFTYYYKAVQPGTFFYHCHVEAAEHMQMGMIGNLWVYPQQDGTSINYQGRTYTKFAYNDGDGSTGYDREYPLLMTGFDPNFHDASENVGVLPFAAMHDTYSMINGRGYPDAIRNAAIGNQDDPEFDAQVTPTIIEANQGERILLRVSNISTTHIYSFATTIGKPMIVVGRGAALLRGPDGKNTTMTLNVLNVGGGQHYDVILDTAGVPAGTYFLYATTLENLSNGDQERGGIMTEIRIN
ncbi:MAG: multicopper oxidase domain-containing protein [Desulfobacterales bacterium]